MSLTLSPLALIIANYNAGLAPALQLNESDFTFDLPLEYTQPNSSANTLVVARPKANSGKYGLVRVRYKRLRVSDLRAATPPIFSARVTRASLVAYLREYLSIPVEEADFLPVAGPFYVDGSTPSVVLRAAPASYLLRGTALLPIAYEGPAPIVPLSEVLDHLTLQGFSGPPPLG